MCAVGAGDLKAVMQLDDIGVFTSTVPEVLQHFGFVALVSGVLSTKDLEREVTHVGGLDQPHGREAARAKLV